MADTLLDLYRGKGGGRVKYLGPPVPVTSSGWPERAPDQGDVMGRVVPQGGASAAMIEERMRGEGTRRVSLGQSSEGAASHAGRVLQDPASTAAQRSAAASALSQRVSLGQGTMPPTMAAVSLGLQRRAGDTWVSVPEGGLVQPNETIRLIADGLAPFKTVRFFVARESNLYLNQIAQAGSGGGANTVFAAPTVEGRYVALLEVDGRTQASLQFGVSVEAPAPPKPPPGGDGFFGGIKTLALIALGIVALATVGPAIGRIGKD